MVNPELSSILHQDGGAKPFTVSAPGSARGAGRSAPSNAVSIRLTFMKEDVFANFLDAVWGVRAGTAVSLAGMTVVVDRLYTTRLQSRWAATASFENLLEDAGAERRLCLAFLSPTTFRSKGERNVLFPEPALVFGSLSSRWNAFAPPTLSLTLPEGLAASVRLAGYRLATRILDFGSYQETGFVGQAAYSLGDELTEDQVMALQALGSFALFGGIGAKTTMGLGQSKKIG